MEGHFSGSYQFARVLHSPFPSNAVTATVADDKSWIRAFSNVVRLKLHYGTRISHFVLHPRPLVPESPCVVTAVFEVPPLDTQVITIICSLPHLKDLDLKRVMVSDRDGDSADFQPPVLPPLTGSLTIERPRESGRLLFRLFDLPNSVHFRKLKCYWDFRKDIEWTSASVEACSNDLEEVNLESLVYCKSHRSAHTVGPAPGSSLYLNQGIQAQL